MPRTASRTIYKTALSATAADNAATERVNPANGVSDAAADSVGYLDNAAMDNNGIDLPPLLPLNDGNLPFHHSPSHTYSTEYEDSLVAGKLVPTPAKLGEDTITSVGDGVCVDIQPQYPVGTPVLIDSLSGDLLSGKVTMWSDYGHGEVLYTVIFENGEHDTFYEDDLANYVDEEKLKAAAATRQMTVSP